MYRSGTMMTRYLRFLMLPLLVTTTSLGCGIFESSTCSSHTDCDEAQYCNQALPGWPKCVDTARCDGDDNCESRFHCVLRDDQDGVCVPYCGDGIVQEDQGETCDQDCRDCRPVAISEPECFVFHPSTGSAETCDFQCGEIELICEDPHCCSVYACPEDAPGCQ